MPHEEATGTVVRGVCLGADRRCVPAASPVAYPEPPAGARSAPAPGLAALFVIVAQGGEHLGKGTRPSRVRLDPDAVLAPGEVGVHDVPGWYVAGELGVELFLADDATRPGSRG
jgi:hypothetical protein